MKTYIKVENDTITAVARAGNMQIPQGEETLWEETTDQVEVGMVRDGSGWSDVELRWEEVRVERDRRINNVMWRVQRYEREVRMEMTPTDDISVLDAYIQELADIPETQTDPNDITWPSEPA